ncbi:SHOCT domain-containing protein [Carnobacterium pleistocenium]|uniref:SHOCT domain-containing protein n=1 Tax=Carnobacterium pleistocenium TaxID=181073 RepID=UPI00055921CB|nr:SHOCT domain-containing protein [Carnobacterium pleistocenium]
MGLFGSGKSKEKLEEKKNQKKLDNQFNELTKGASTYVIQISEDLFNKANHSIMTMNIHSDGRTYLRYSQPGSLTKHTNEMEAYNMIEFEWLENIQVKGKKVLSRSIIGLGLAGPSGMIVGGLSGKNKTKDKSTAILIMQNTETKEVRTFSFKCDKKQMRKYKMIPTVPLMENSNSISFNSSPTEQLKEYKELLDLEIINQKEFDMKKAELLSM